MDTQSVVNILNQQASAHNMPIQVDSVAEMKRKFIGWVIHFWYIVVIIVLVITLAFYRNSLIKTKTELEIADGKAKLAISMGLTEEHLAEMKQREAELYPLLEQKKGELNAVQSQIEKERSKLKAVKKETIAASVRKMDIDTLSKELNRMGYSNTVTK